jgi:hypothetical protein
MMSNHRLAAVPAPDTSEEDVPEEPIIAMDGIRRARGRGKGKELTVPNAGTQLETILSEFIKAGERGRIDDEIEVLTGLRHSSVSARRAELEDQGWIYGTKEGRPTRGQKTAQVFCLSKQGASQAGLTNYVGLPPADIEDTPEPRTRVERPSGETRRKRTPKSKLRPPPHVIKAKEREQFLSQYRTLIWSLVSQLNEANAPGPKELAAFFTKGNMPPVINHFHLRRSAQYLLEMSKFLDNDQENQ